jgi:Ni/Fe-hydrogenase subunit HybB-like protein
MNEQPKTTTPTHTPASAPGKAQLVERRPLFPISRSWKIASIVAAIMVLLALLGVGPTTTNSAAAPTYWISLVPVYGLLCVSLAWARAQHEPGSRRPAVIRQLFHWLGIGVAVGLDFYIRGAGAETGTAAGMNALLLLALGCYLAGIHLEWLFVLVGMLLTLALLVVAKADQYLWLIFVVGGVAVAAMLALGWYLGKTRSPSGDTVKPVSSVPAGL